MEKTFALGDDGSFAGELNSVLHWEKQKDETECFTRFAVRVQGKVSCSEPTSAGVEGIQIRSDWIEMERSSENCPAIAPCLLETETFDLQCDSKL